MSEPATASSSYELVGSNGDVELVNANKVFVTPQKYGIELMFADVDFKVQPPHSGRVIKNLSLPLEETEQLIRSLMRAVEQVAKAG